MSNDDIEFCIKLIGFKNEISKTVDLCMNYIRSGDITKADKLRSLLNATMNTFDRHQVITGNSFSGEDSDTEFFSDSDDDIKTNVTEADKSDQSDKYDPLELSVTDLCDTGNKYGFVRNPRNENNKKVLGLDYSADPSMYESLTEYQLSDTDDDKNGDTDTHINMRNQYYQQISGADKEFPQSIGDPITRMRGDLIKIFRPHILEGDDPTELPDSVEIEIDLSVL